VEFEINVPDRTPDSEVEERESVEANAGVPNRVDRA
jgi:hypothetical protein